MIENEMTVSVPLEVVKASEIEPKEVKWLWYPYIPVGKVTLLQGDPGDGKSKLMLSIAALLSKGEPLPFTETEENEPMTIIYQTTEDDADDTVVPRFNSAGGNGENLIFIKEDEKSLSFGDNRIREAIEMYHAKLLILDPMSSYIGESCSMNNANETRAEFNHLIAVAKDTGCAIVIIAHMNKMRDTNPLYRTNGSIDIAGAARSILAITRTPNKEAPAERYMVQVKSNLAPTGSAILFEVAEKGVDFISEMEMTAEEAFQSLAPKIGRPNDKEVKAKAFLIEMLKDGEMLSSDCEEKLEAAGFKKSTIKKAKKKAGIKGHSLEGKNIALIFEKPSTRTRCAFTVGAQDEGGIPTYLAGNEIQLGDKESIEDTARVLGRMFDGIEFRGFEQRYADVLAEYSGVPVWNGLTNEYHPTQMLADMLTIRENFGELKGRKLVYMGDARFNMGNSLMIACSKLGMHFVACTTKEYFPNEELVETCKGYAAQSVATITLTEDVKEGTKGADVIYTDVWVSMGEPDEVWEERIKDLTPYKVTSAVMKNAGEKAIFLHCLPAFHDLKTKIGKEMGERFNLTDMEVTDEVFESAQSHVFDEAENRMHTIKAVMVATLGEPETK